MAIPRGDFGGGDPPLFPIRLLPLSSYFTEIIKLTLGIVFYSIEPNSLEEASLLFFFLKILQIQVSF